MIQERIGGRVYVCQPVGHRVEAAGNQVGVNRNDVEGHVEGHPADEEGHDDVGQGQEKLPLTRQRLAAGRRWFDLHAATASANGQSRLRGRSTFVTLLHRAVVFVRDLHHPLTISSRVLYAGTAVLVQRVVNTKVEVNPICTACH